MPRASMGGSTIRTAAGKAADCGARAATARPGSRKAARARCRAQCTSSFGPIRWRTEVREKFERPASRDAFAQSYVLSDRRAKRALSDPHARCQSSLLLLAVALTQAARDSTAIPSQTER